MAKHHFKWSALEHGTLRPDYSTTEGGTLTGQKIEVGSYRMKAGTGANLFSHPNEQIVCILKGRLQYWIGDEEGIAEAGDVIYMPANIPHRTRALEDVAFISSKDMVDGHGSR